MAEQVEMKAKVVQSEIQAVTARHKKALEDRECELLWKVRGAQLPQSAPSGLVCTGSEAQALSLERVGNFPESLRRGVPGMQGVTHVAKQQEILSEGPREPGRARKGRGSGFLLCTLKRRPASGGQSELLLAEG